MVVLPAMSFVMIITSIPTGANRSQDDPEYPASLVVGVRPRWPPRQHRFKKKHRPKTNITRSILQSNLKWSRLGFGSSMEFGSDEYIQSPPPPPLDRESGSGEEDPWLTRARQE